MTLRLSLSSCQQKIFPHFFEATAIGGVRVCGTGGIVVSNVYIPDVGKLSIARFIYSIFPSKVLKCRSSLFH